MEVIWSVFYRCFVFQVTNFFLGYLPPQKKKRKGLVGKHMYILIDGERERERKRHDNRRCTVIADSSKPKNPNHRRPLFNPNLPAKKQNYQTNGLGVCLCESLSLFLFSLSSVPLTLSHITHSSAPHQRNE